MLGDCIYVAAAKKTQTGTEAGNGLPPEMELNPTIHSFGWNNDGMQRDV